MNGKHKEVTKFPESSESGITPHWKPPWASTYQFYFQLEEQLQSGSRCPCSLHLPAAQVGRPHICRRLQASVLLRSGVL